MKKKIWVWLLFLFVNLSYSQEWMTSLSVAKRLAIAQNKMLFVMWEDATTYPYPLGVIDDRGRMVITDLFEDEKINEIIWEYFVPVRLPESQYEDLFKEVDGKRSAEYIDKFNDEGIKIMDVNGNILNLDEPYYEIFDLQDFIERYALNMESLQPFYMNYRETKNYNTTLRLANKLYDFAILNKKEVREEIVKLANIYSIELRQYIAQESDSELETLMQMSELNTLKQYLILNRPRKVLRELKKMEERMKVLEPNTSLHAFLNYTAYKLMDKEKDAESWKSDVSLADIRRAQLIININK